MPNISAVQRPSPPSLETKKRDKILMALAGGGYSLGYSARVAKGIGLEPDRWPAAPAGDAVAHSVDALDPLCERTLRLAS